MFRKLLLPVAVLWVGGSAGCSGGSNTLNEMRIEKIIPVGTVPFEAPLLYQKEEGLVGPDALLAEQIGEKIKAELADETTAGSRPIELRWITRQYDTLGNALINKEVDLILGVYGITPERQAEVTFSKPYYTSELVMIINPLHQDIRSNQLDGRTIGVREGTAVARFVSDNYPRSQTVPFKTLDDAVLALKRSEVNAIIDDRNMGAYSLDTVPGVAHLEIVPGVLGTVECGVAVRKNDERLLKIINTVIDEVVSQNRYARWVQEETGDLVARVEARHGERLENQRLAAEPRRLVIRVSKDDGYDFDIYKMANLSFVLTDEKSGETFTTSRIDFQGRVGVSSTSVPPGIYKITLPKMNNWSPGAVGIQAKDPDQITVNIRLLPGGTVRMTRS